jgi:hypothetical protein
MMKFLVLAVLALGSALANANGISYLSSSAGYMLHRSNNNIAVTSNWQGQSPMASFSGYGTIQMDNRCLTGRNGRQPLTWENCARGRDPAQIWGFRNGRLNNELGWCADVEGNRRGAGVRVMAWQCSGATNQRWKAHRPEPTQSVINRIKDNQTRQTIQNFTRRARPGEVLRLPPAQAKEVPAELLHGENQDALISAGGLGLISAGGLG